MCFFNVFLHFPIFVIAGMKVASKVIPEGLITGPLPESLKGPKKTTQYACKKAFTEEDICCVEMYLDQLMADKSTGSKYALHTDRHTHYTHHTHITHIAHPDWKCI